MSSPSSLLSPCYLLLSRFVSLRSRWSGLETSSFTRLSSFVHLLTTFHPLLLIRSESEFSALNSDITSFESILNEMHSCNQQLILFSQPTEEAGEQTDLSLANSSPLSFTSVYPLFCTLFTHWLSAYDNEFLCKSLVIQSIESIYKRISMQTKSTEEDQMQANQEENQRKFHSQFQFLSSSSPLSSSLTLLSSRSLLSDSSESELRLLELIFSLRPFTRQIEKTSDGEFHSVSLINCPMIYESLLSFAVLLQISLESSLSNDRTPVKTDGKQMKNAKSNKEKDRKQNKKEEESWLSPAPVNRAESSDKVKSSAKKKNK
jgi:hypothetical protein